MKVAVKDQDYPLTRRVLTIFTDEPGKEWHIEDLAVLLNEDQKKVRTAINNLRAGNPQLAPKIKVVVPGTLYRYDNGDQPEPEPVKPPPLPRVEHKREVQDTPLPSTKLEETPVAERPPEKVKDDDLVIFRKLGLTSKGTIIAEGEDDQLYAIRVVDL